MASLEAFASSRPSVLVGQDPMASYSNEKSNTPTQSESLNQLQTSVPPGQLDSESSSNEQILVSQTVAASVKMKYSDDSLNTVAPSFREFTRNSRLCLMTHDVLRNTLINSYLTYPDAVSLARTCHFLSNLVKLSAPCDRIFRIKNIRAWRKSFPAARYAFIYSFKTENMALFASLLQGIRYLKLFCCFIDETLFSSLPELIELEIVGNEHKEKCSSRYWKHMKNLKIFRTEGMAELYDEDFVYFRGLHTLDLLRVWWVTEKGLHHLQGSSLHELHLWNPRYTYYPTLLQPLAGIHTLYLKEIKEEQLQWLRGTTKLYLDNPSITDDAFIYFQGLHSLDLQFSKVTGSGFRYLAGIHSLGLSSSRNLRKGCFRITELSSLRVLDLSLLNEKLLIEESEFEYLGRLSTLLIAQSHLIKISCFKFLSELEVLDIYSCNQFTKDNVLELLNYLPKLKKIFVSDSTQTELWKFLESNHIKTRWPNLFVSRRTVRSVKHEFF